MENEIEQTGGDEDWPTFEQISDPKSPYFDRYWFESDVIPIESPWFKIAGEFLYCKAMLRSFSYKGKSPITQMKGKAISETIKKHLNDIENYIRFKITDPEFTVAMMELVRNFEKLKWNSTGYKDRKKIAKLRRSGAPDIKKKWYALWVIKGQSLGKNRPTVNRILARVIEEMKAKKRAVPEPYELEWFTKMLNKKSKYSSPLLAQPYTKNFKRTDIVKAAKTISEEELPPVWEGNLSP